MKSFPSVSPRCLEDLDPVVAALQREFETGKLQRDTFYNTVQNALEFAPKYARQTQNVISSAEDIPYVAVPTRVSILEVILC